MASLTFDTRAAAIAATVSADVTVIFLAGYYTRGDASTAEYVRITGPTSEITFTTANNVIFTLVCRGPMADLRWFGCKIDGATDDDAAFRVALKVASPEYAYPHVSCRTLYLPKGCNRLSVDGLSFKSESIAVTGATHGEFVNQTL